MLTPEQRIVAEKLLAELDKIESDYKIGNIVKAQAVYRTFNIYTEVRKIEGPWTPFLSAIPKLIDVPLTSSAFELFEACKAALAVMYAAGLKDDHPVVKKVTAALNKARGKA